MRPLRSRLPRIQKYLWLALLISTTGNALLLQGSGAARVLFLASALALWLWGVAVHVMRWRGLADGER